MAKRIENGGPIPAARFEKQRQNEATRIAREDLTLSQQERKPSFGMLMDMSYGKIYDFKPKMTQDLYKNIYLNL